MWVYVFHVPSAYQLCVPRPYRLEDMAHYVCLRQSACDPDIWPFDLETGGNVARVMGYRPANFGDTMTIRFRFMGHWANTAQTDHVTLWPWRLTLEVMEPVADGGRRPPSVYRV